MEPTPSEPSLHGHRERLRERFRRAGLEGFADYELVELLLTFVIPRRDTKPLAKVLVERFGGLKGVLDAGPADLSQVDGIGAQAAVFLPLIKAVFKRYFEWEVRETDPLTSPEAVVAYARAHLEGLKNEVFDVIYLSTKNRVIARDRLSEGTLDRSAVYPRRVLAGAFQHNAAAMIFVHNHPSGDPKPSPEDRALTRLLAQVAKGVDVSVLDHLIIGNGRYFSFREAGLLNG